MKKFIVFALVAVCWLAGCRQGITFPAESLTAQAQAAGATAAYAPHTPGKAEVFFFADANGRVTRIGYDTTGNQKPDQIVDIDCVPCQHCRHLVIILDGFGYDVVKQFYDEGHLRFCYPPSRVIAPYPTLTDVCLEDVFNYAPCGGMEDVHYDRTQGKIVGGASSYLAGTNQVYNRLLQYRASLIWDAIGYLYPWKIFGKEINDCKQGFEQRKTKEFIAYFVSSAGMGTIEGAAGQRRSLELVDRFVNQVMWETHGLTKVTILADHGHSYTPGTRLDFDKPLKAKGWNMVDKTLKGPRDVIYIQFGLVTYAAFATNNAPALATDLSAVPGVEIASYTQGDKVVVLSRDGQKALIGRGPCETYSYTCETGDPLGYKDILAKLPNKDGFYTTADVLKATADAHFPAALERVYRAHFALVDHPPDVIVSLEDKYWSGNESFAGSVKIASTHGSLNKTNSTTFIMSSAGPLPPLLRSRDVSPAMQQITGKPFPSRE